MTPDLPPVEDILPAVEHVMGTLDHDAGTIQAIADRMVNHVGDSLVPDKKEVTRLKSALVRRVNNTVIKQDNPVLSEIGARARAAVAQSIADDQESVDRFMSAASNSGALMAPAPAQPIATAGLLDAITGAWQCVDQSPPTPRTWVWYGMRNGLNDVAIPPNGPPPGGDERGHGRRISPSTLGWYWINGDASIARCDQSAPPPVPPPPGPPPVPQPVPNILPPPVPAPIPLPGPPTPSPPPVPPPCPQPCGPLPTDIPCIATYVVPWLEPGIGSPSVYSDCGKKLIADSLTYQFPAFDAAQALQTLESTLAWIGPPPPSYRPPLSGLDYVAPSPGEYQ